jgi:hypothetical protein
MIAAHALEAGSILVTYDDYFIAVPGSRICPENASQAEARLSAGVKNGRDSGIIKKDENAA